MSFWDLIFPVKCVGCGKAGKYFCSACLTAINKIGQICPICERPTSFGQTHAYCWTRNSLDGLISLFAYEGIIKEAIYKLKYEFVTDLEDEFWEIIQSNLRRREEEIIVLKKFAFEKDPLVIPVPLYWYKEHKRGFNQSLLFAKRLAGLWKLQFSDKTLVRIKNVPSQTKLTQKERKENVREIFRFSPIRNSLCRNFLLIDDVWTTGATLKEAAKTIKSAGAEKVWGLTIAR